MNQEVSHLGQFIVSNLKKHKNDREKCTLRVRAMLILHVYYTLFTDGLGFNLGSPYNWFNLQFLERYLYICGLSQLN